MVEPPGPIVLVPGPPGDAAPVRSRAVVAVVAVAMIGIVVLFLAGLGFFLSVAQDTWTVGGWR